MAGKADIKLGYTCNNRCVHCVVTDQRERAAVLRGSTDRTTAEFLRELADAHRRGLSDIVFTGGEPTIRRDLGRLMAHARDLGFRLHVQSNARMLAYRPLAVELCQFDATWVVALHGPSAAVHDRVTEAPGSFDQTVAGLGHLREFGRRVVGKIVLSRLNIAHLPETVGALVAAGARAVNVAFPHALGRARELFDTVVPRYSEAIPHVHRACDQYGATTVLYFEAIPLCLMRGYEHHVAEAACLALKQPSIHKQLDMETRDWREARLEQKQKFAACRACIHDAICEGPWREYAEHFGGDEFVPVTA